MKASMRCNCSTQREAAVVFNQPRLTRDLKWIVRPPFQRVMNPPKRAVDSGVNPLFATAAFLSGIFFTITVTGPANSTICGSLSPKAGGNVQ